MRSSIVLLTALASVALAAPKPDVDCITKGNTVIEIYDTTVTEIVYVTEGAPKPTSTYVPAHTTSKRKKHKHTTSKKPKPTTTPAPVYTPPPPEDNTYVVTITEGSDQQAPPPPQDQAPPPPQDESPPPQQVEKPADGSSPEDFTNAHNFYRSKYGCSPLSWSEELVAYARDHSRCEMEHTGGPYGENLAMGTNLSGTSSVDMWAGEAPKYDYGNPTFSGETGHFSQVVWKGTQQVGCYVTNCGDSNLVMCEYSPPGNMMGDFANNVPAPL